MNKVVINRSGNLPEIQENIWPFFRLAFRPFFWLGALFSIICTALWLANFSLGMAFSPMGGSYFWHLHEMLFGFVVAIIVGFLLTAVQSWTQVSSVKGWPLAALVIIWLLGRIAMLAPGYLPSYFISGVDLLFLPLAAVCLAVPVIKARMWRNLMFVPILLLMALLNGWMHYALTHPSPVSFLSLAHTMIMLVALVMCVMGGRVFPMFTANGTQTPRVASLPWLERCAIFSVLLCVPISLQIIVLPTPLEAGIYLFAGLANMIRAFRWRIWVTFGAPQVWSLHVSYWAMALGLVLVGLSEINVFKSASAAYHAITVGGMGVMILSMISRVSLGHTGRPIVASPIMTLSFVLMMCAFVVRVLSSFSLGYSHSLMLIAGGLWVLAYGIFVVTYFPILFRSRVDRKPG